MLPMVTLARFLFICRISQRAFSFLTEMPVLLALFHTKEPCLAKGVLLPDGPGGSSLCWGCLGTEKPRPWFHLLQSPFRVCLPHRSREHPDLQLWCQPWKQHSGDGRSHSRHIQVAEAKSKEEAPSYRTLNGAVEKPLPLPQSVEESYITSEHCYQKPRAYYPAVEQKLVVETRGSALDDAVNPLRENGDDSLSPRLGWPLDQDRHRGDSDPKSSSPKVGSLLVLVLNSVSECF